VLVTIGQAPSPFSGPTSTERALLLRSKRWRPADAVGIATALADRSVEVRYEAAEALGRLLLKRRRAPRALLRAATDRNSSVRTCVAEALGDIGDPAAIPALKRLIEDPHAVVRSYAASSLAAVAGSRARLLLQRSAARDRSTLARVGHLGALIAIGERDYVEGLIALLGSRQYRVRCATANTLAALRLRADDRAHAIRALEGARANEPTVAASSTIDAALKELRQRRGR
jgi:HEAT repeat protein